MHTKVKNWKEHIENLLTSNAQYIRIPTGIHGETETEIYKPTIETDFTQIKAGYLSNGELIYLQFENPLSVGFTEQQNREYFYRYAFDPNDSYGDPGLLYTEQNIEAINRLLTEGLNGKEIQYFNNDQLIKSEIYYSYGSSEPCDYPTTINFIKQSFWTRIKSIFKQADEPTSVKEINLAELFNGLKAL